MTALLCNQNQTKGLELHHVFKQKNSLCFQSKSILGKIAADKMTKSGKRNFKPQVPETRDYKPTFGKNEVQICPSVFYHKITSPGAF